MFLPTSSVFPDWMIQYIKARKPVMIKMYKSVFLNFFMNLLLSDWCYSFLPSKDIINFRKLPKVAEETVGETIICSILPSFVT
jgi:hypothetical protein